MNSETPTVTYLRVSTDRQGQSGLGLDAQRMAVATYVAMRPVLGEFVEVESGRKNDRPQLVAALALCRHRCAVLEIAKLDRLARSVAFISNLMTSGVEFVAADMPQANRLTIHIVAAVAEHASLSASHLSIVCDGSTGSQVIADPRDNHCPDALYPAGVGGIIGTVGGLRLER